MINKFHQYQQNEQLNTKKTMTYMAPDLRQATKQGINISGNEYFFFL